jgi:putative membrane protein insertion efficiency factor
MRRALWAAGLPARSVLLGVLALYRVLVSPALSALVGPRCRYQPSCSAYAQEAIRIHGAAKGLLLAGWRLLRCSPLHPGGLDPVPPRGAAWPGGRPGRRRYDGVTQSAGGEA